MHSAIARLTLDQKAALLSGASFWSTLSIPEAGIDAAVLTDGPHGVRYQKETGDHLGINDSEPATAFPTAAATGSTWDPALLERMGEALGRESRALGVDVLLGPGVNIKRSPLCGRNFEYFSEDPTLAGALGAAWVRGVQSQGVGASLKHFAANNQETERMRVSAEVDERTLREIYLPAFEQTVKESQPATVMCSYNRINGTYASEHPWLLTQVLREEWGYQGYVVSDWGAVNNSARAVAAGLDLAMPAGTQHAPKIVAAVAAGDLDEAVLDRAIDRILTVHEGLRARQAEVASSVDAAAHHALAREVAAAGTVLLVNDGILPLDPASTASIGVIGEFARTPRYQGAGSSHIVPTQLDNALDALVATSAGQVTFAPGFRLDGDEDTLLVQEAVAVASQSDVVVLFLGLPDAEESEGFDRTHLNLPSVQLELLDAVLAANPRVVTVLSNGSVVDLGALAGRMPAVLETWLGGQASGSATVDVLFGAAEPGGRLAETIPVSLADTPAHINWPGTPESVLYGERLYVGYRWYDTVGRDVRFPFGHGLSYTTFALSDVAVDLPDSTQPQATVAVTVTNTGARTGSHVVQLYVRDLESTLDRPAQELKAFAKVTLEPGQSERVLLSLDARAFAFWGRTGWVVEPGTFELAIGHSSRDIVAVETIELTMEPVIEPLGEDATYADWVAHPVGAQVLADALQSIGGFVSQTMANDPDLAKLLESVPLRTLLGFGGDVDGEVAAAELTSRANAALAASAAAPANSETGWESAAEVEVTGKRVSNQRTRAN
ncbi:glycoside hydrolase family 3 C-terminal domain-containing protein [Micrococcales bacterium 31B]|nr:glycoside hydrolase family 3 C-terminal domain-containing protein [Micrococcales bacterium 31B]